MSWLGMRLDSVPHTSMDYYRNSVEEAGFRDEVALHKKLLDSNPIRSVAHTTIPSDFVPTRRDGSAIGLVPLPLREGVRKLELGETPPTLSRVSIASSSD